MINSFHINLKINPEKAGHLFSSHCHHHRYHLYNIKPSLKTLKQRKRKMGIQRGLLSSNNNIMILILLASLMICSKIERVDAMSWWNMPWKPFGKEIEAYKKQNPSGASQAELCVNSLTHHCGSYMYDYIFRFTSFTSLCCERLLKNGEECNNHINDFITSIGRFKKYSSRIRDMSSKLYHWCDEVAR